jgi:hypothetical protein
MLRLRHWCRRYTFDSSIYPVLAAEYVGDKLNLGALAHGDEGRGKLYTSWIIIAAVTAIKLAGTDWMVRAQGALFVGTMAPVIVRALSPPFSCRQHHAMQRETHSPDAPCRNAA